MFRSRELKLFNVNYGDSDHSSLTQMHGGIYMSGFLNPVVWTLILKVARECYQHDRPHPMILLSQKHLQRKMYRKVNKKKSQIFSELFLSCESKCSQIHPPHPSHMASACPSLLRTRTECERNCK